MTQVLTGTIAHTIGTVTYDATFKWDVDAQSYHGRLSDLRDIVTFEAATLSELEAAFVDSIEDYIDFCESRGEEPEKPFSGKFLVRISPETHRDIAKAARREGRSVNAWVAATLTQGVATQPSVLFESWFVPNLQFQSIPHIKAPPAYGQQFKPGQRILTIVQSQPETEESLVS